MTEEQFQILMDYIDAKIDERIEAAFGRDRLLESIRANELRTDLRAVFQVEVKDDDPAQTGNSWREIARKREAQLIALRTECNRYVEALTQISKGIYTGQACAEFAKTALRG